MALVQRCRGLVRILCGRLCGPASDDAEVLLSYTPSFVNPANHDHPRLEMSWSEYHHLKDEWENGGSTLHHRSFHDLDLSGLLVEPTWLGLGLGIKY